MRGLWWPRKKVATVDGYEGSQEDDEVAYDYALRMTGTLPNGTILATSPQFPHRQFAIIPEYRSDP
jgi:hypothetical protein